MEDLRMKFLITTVAALALLGGSAFAQTSEGGGRPTSRENAPRSLERAQPINPSAVQPATPNNPYGAAGGTTGMGRPNPDRVAPNSPGGQGSPPN
jgi:hypothetical protein